MIKNKTGVWGEYFAARHLRDKGYKIVAANFASKFGEIDIVAQKGDVVAFCEVKTRNINTKTSPMEAVDEEKQSRLLQTANAFTKLVKAEGKQRFDVCEVWLDDDNKLVKINYIENAF